MAALCLLEPQKQKGGVSWGTATLGSLGRSWLPGGLFSFVCFALLFSWFCINQKFVDIKSGCIVIKLSPFPR